MMVHFNYKAYADAPMATFVSALTQGCGAILVVTGIFTALEDFDLLVFGVVSVAVGILLMILGNIWSTHIAKKKYQKLYGKNGEKLSKLVPMRMEEREENGERIVEEVPDVESGVLNPPAKIILCREKGIGLGIEYYLNEQPLGKIKSGQEISVQTLQAVNSVRAGVPRQQGVTKPMQFIVRSGEEVRIRYRAYTYIDIERLNMPG